MPSLLEQVARARDNRRDADQTFRAVLVQARNSGHTWAELANIAGLTISGVRYLALDLNQKRKKGGKDA